MLKTQPCLYVHVLVPRDKGINSFISRFMELTDRAVDEDANSALEPLLESTLISEDEKTTLVRIWEIKEKIRVSVWSVGVGV